MAASEPGDLQHNLIRLASRLGVKKVGFADLSRSGHPLTAQFPVGIPLLMPMENSVINSADEAAFHQEQFRQRDELEAIKAKLGDFYPGMDTTGIPSATTPIRSA